MTLVNNLVVQKIQSKLRKYIYIYIQLFCLFRVLMVDIFIIFRVQHLFRVQITTFGGAIVIFYTFRVHQVQIKKVTLNRNLNKGGGSGVPRRLK